MGSRRDLVVIGATGYTGKLICEHLARRQLEEKFTWAISGRSSSKLAELRASLLESVPGASFDIVTCDLEDLTQLSDTVKEFNVVISAAGPYAQMGSKLVQACVEQRTHYCDITGEVWWVKQMIQRFHEPAEKNRIKIVSCCGFDSIPSDLGSFFLAKEVFSQFGVPVDAIESSQECVGGVSAGTVHSLVGAFESPWSERWDMLRSKYLILSGPALAQEGLDIDWIPSFDRDLNSWKSFFVMSLINSRVVIRSVELWKRSSKSNVFSSDFRYHEYGSYGKGIAGFFTSLTILVVFFLLGILLPIKPFANFLKSKFPSGYGPSEETRKSGWFKTYQKATFKDKSGQTRSLRSVVVGGDPGYGATSILVAESGICLSKNASGGIGTPEIPGGVLTPSVAMGQPLLDQLNANGVKFSLV